MVSLGTLALATAITWAALTTNTPQTTRTSLQQITHTHTDTDTHTHTHHLCTILGNSTRLVLLSNHEAHDVLFRART
jgi:hemoglobin-like flavoprotein